MKVNFDHASDALNPDCMHCLPASQDDTENWPHLAEQCQVLKQFMAHQALHDPQTGLLNLDGLIAKIDDNEEVRANIGVSCLFVSGISDIGNHYGVEAALHTLRNVASTIKHIVGESGFVARAHGDLFVCSMPVHDIDTITLRLKHALSSAVLWKSEEFYLGVFVGVAGWNSSFDCAEALIKASYAALIACQRNGCSGEVYQYSDELGQSLQRQYFIKARLRHALSDNLFELFLQPKHHVASGALIGAEVLIRWQDEVLGEVTPGEFIPLAEHSGLICQITRWVIKSAFKLASDLHEIHPQLLLAVNISAMDLHSPRLVSDVRKSLKESGCKAGRIVFEITESAVAKDTSSALRQLKALKKMGINIALDDFGTGYSSLGQLRQLPIDILKIDRSFVADLPGCTNAKSTVRAIIAMAHAMGIEVVGEGVENNLQYQYLKFEELDYAQGYLMSKPVRVSDFKRYCINNRFFDPCKMIS
jgi:EAL domain-containing protein (putative c-di-GMP-specific phosphodiesterase class I)/GGDEF domain-containing protein